MAWQKHRNMAWEGSQGDLPVWGWHQHWGLKHSEEGSSGQSWLSSYGGSQINQSFHRAKKEQTSTEVCCLETSRCSALGCPCHQDLCLSLPTQHPAWAPCSAQAMAGTGYWLQMHFSAADRNAIFFYTYLQIAWVLKYNLWWLSGEMRVFPG